MNGIACSKESSCVTRQSSCEVTGEEKLIAWGGSLSLPSLHLVFDLQSIQERWLLSGQWDDLE